jgi:hypothetical protein
VSFSLNEGGERQYQDLRKEVIRMLLFMVEKDSFVITDASEKTVREFWKNYHAFRYDFNFSFDTFLKENGIYARVALPLDIPFSYRLTDLEISLN